ncbi:two component transcriptional regulator, winged helix family [Sulfurimonas gotlandica GD1]|uniref:Two component transcriptional regulator, winged helix family n=1 Tax=Sulfurimonas gotlandica (strain DSM 19862 / JCM 16533 / GD1) TaxID=929558 RepID=B6BJ93_SULGG|nr:response regulator [Sulfurimonas gotlandica]EDZ63727.1 two component transcriptional regulator, winged helix family [Sulfurimonas gotlandica GD1]EHP30611.1 two component transcriptional regulator, winged helix family [Sulfurimonas gotlandica GD1]
MVKNSIIVVEDDEITALNLNLSLQKHGYNVIAVCDNATQAKNKIQAYKPDLVIIDISLDESNDGIELAKVVRQKYNIPFIFLTSYSDDDIIAQAKLTEPYGYIVKPFDPNSLHATIQMAIFKYEVENERKDNIDSLKVDKLNLEKLLYSKRASDKPIVPFGDKYHLDISVCETFYNGKKIKLTKKENAFLRLLVAQLGLVVSFEQAMNYVWDESGATENSVRTLVWRLRNKLETDIIKNASGIGYYIEE